jgi:uncharacterized membrane protein
MRQRRSLVMLVVAALLLAGCSERQLHATEPGERLGVAVDVNEADVILTAGFVADTPVAFLLSAGSRDIRGIPGPDGAGFVPYALNDAGAVVGAVITGSGRTQKSQAVRWTDADGFTLLPFPGGTFQSWATDINARGQVTVNAFSPSGSPGDGAYVWQAGAGLARLADPGGAPNGRASVAEAINDQGVVVGASGNGEPAGRERAREWGVTRVPETLGSPGETSRALDVNEAGTVVGSTVTGAGSQRAAAWITAAHSFLDLGPGVANGLNDSNVVVGQAERPGALPRANLWVVPTLVSLPLGDPASTRGSNANALNSRRAVGDAGGEAVEFFF